MPHQNVPSTEIEDRILRLQRELQQLDLGGALIISPLHMLYLAGTIQQGALYVPAAGEAVLLVRRSLERAELESPLLNIRQMASYRQFAAILADYGLEVPERLGLEYSIPMDVYGRVAKYVQAEFVDLQITLAQMRARKSQWEIDCLRQAGELQARNFAGIGTLFRPGMSELQLGAAIEHQMLLLGHHGTSVIQSFGNELHIGYVSAGENAYFPHRFDGPGGCRGICTANPELGSSRTIGENEPVLIDLVFGVSGYHVDMTRIFCQGEPPQEAQDWQQRCEEIQQMIVERLRPGNTPAQIWDEVWSRVSELGWQENLMGFGDRAVRFWGHGVGLAVDEYPALARGFDEPLEAGMVLAVEPKKALEGIGVVGVENTWLVRDGAPEKLTDLADGIQPLGTTG